MAVFGPPFLIFLLLHISRICATLGVMTDLFDCLLHTYSVLGSFVFFHFFLYLAAIIFATFWLHPPGS